MARVRISVAAATGRLAMIVIPDRDEELEDRAFQPDNCRGVDIERGVYEALTIDGSLPPEAAVLGLIRPLVAADDAVLGQRVAARIAALDMEAVQPGSPDGLA